MKKILTIEGMSCGHCVNHVETALSAIDGVAEVIVNLDEKTAYVTLDKEVEDTVLSEAVKDAGYKVTDIR